MYLSNIYIIKKLGILSDITLHHWLKQGKITAKTSSSGTHLYNISSIFQSLLHKILIMSPLPPPRKVSFTFKSLMPSKKKTLNSRNNFSAPNFWPMNSSATSASNDWDLRLYWNGQVTEWSQKLWLLIMTDSADSPLTSFSLILPPHYKTHSFLYDL